MSTSTLAKDSTAIITGAAGFLGRHTLCRLAAAGYRVAGLARTRPAWWDGCQERLFEADLQQAGTFEEICRSVAQPVTLVHLAARLPASAVALDDTGVAAHNRLIDDHVLRVCQRLRIPVVYASTCSVYGRSGTLPHTEEAAPNHPIPYVAEKLDAEQLGMEWLGGEGIPFTALRISAPYGPAHQARTVMNIFIERALEGEPLLYHGSGSRQQDFVFATDVADAIRLALDRGV
ncbi:MAG: NAD-dependent epimerase/dehydratase family protein, partial [Bryobacteraceae bacterium]